MKEGFLARTLRRMRRDRLVRKLKRLERDLHRPGNIIVGAILSGVLIGACLVGLAWLTWDVTHQTSETGDSAPYVDPNWGDPHSN